MSSLFLLRLQRRMLPLLLVSAASTLLAALAGHWDVFELSSAEKNAYDSGLTAFTLSTHGPSTLRTALTKPFQKAPELSKAICIVAIDDRTFQEVAKDPSLRQDYGAWPYVRTVWAHALTQLHRMGARAVVLDAVVDEAHADPTGDQAMAEAIGRLGIPFYAGFSVTADPSFPEAPKVEAVNRLPAVRAITPRVAAATDEDPFAEASPQAALSPEQVAQALAFPVRALGYPLPLLKPNLEDQQARRTLVPVPPLPDLLRVGPGFGLVLPEEDSDGKMRSTRFAYSDGKNSYVTLSVAAAADLLGAQSLELSPGVLQLGERRIRINLDGTAALDYGGTLKERFSTFSLVDLLRDYQEREANPPSSRIPKEAVAGKVVLIAGFATGTADSKVTPFSSATPGVIKAATEVDALLTGGFITEAPYSWSLGLAFLVALMSAALILVVRSTWLELAWPVALFFGFFLVTGALLVFTRTHLLSVVPTLAGSLASVGATVVNHLSADRRAQQTLAMLSRYMEPQLVEQMVERGQMPTLGGENREITAFFSDIRGFSSFTEAWREDPQKLVRFLNQYLTRVTQVLFDHQGCVDKYIGDAVVCLFGAPFADADHPIHACHAALAVNAEVERMRQEFRARGLPDVYTRIGINTDVMFVGNFGSEQVFDFTAMGDGMNLASRLEGANKSYGSAIMMGENTYQKVRDQVEARELDWVRVAGKHQAVAVYELLSLKGGLSASMRQVTELYAQALALYRRAHFGAAIPLLEQALELNSEDGPSVNLLNRCRKFLTLPPPAPFDGVANLEK